MNTWTQNNNQLEKKFKFTNFKEALHFVNQVGEIAEQEQHHPDIHLVNYNEVEITTTTHDQGNQITDKDTRITELIDDIL